MDKPAELEQEIKALQAEFRALVIGAYRAKTFAEDMALTNQARVIRDRLDAKRAELRKLQAAAR